MSERLPALERPARVLAIGAHPDDAEFYAGATLARLAAEGAAVTIVVCTDGAKGGERGAHDLPARRRAEAARAAAALGDLSLVHLELADGDLVAGDALRALLVREIRRTRPELLLAHDPTTFFLDVGPLHRLGHSDHRAAGQAVLDAVYPRAGLPSFFPEQIDAGLAPWLARELWLFDTTAPDHFVPLGEHATAKRAALEAHASQHPDALLREAGEQARLRARQSGGPEAEAFRRIRVW